MGPVPTQDDVGPGPVPGSGRRGACAGTLAPDAALHVGWGRGAMSCSMYIAQDMWSVGDIYARPAGPPLSGAAQRWTAGVAAVPDSN